tara:strand:- start:222 stop:845 length:624 start_codon:yes stop_codon:yes gene_type:complete
MSGIVQIVGQSSGVSHLLSVDSSGKIASGDSLVLAKNIEILAKNTEIEVSADAILAKNTEILSKNTEIEISVDALISANHTDLLAINSTLGGVLSVSAPVLSATSSTLSNAVSVADSATSTTASTDIAVVRRVMVMGNLTDTSGGSIKVEVSIDNSVFYEDTEQAIYSDASGNFGKTINVDARYIRFKYTNSSGSAQTFTLLMSYKA